MNSPREQDPIESALQDLSKQAADEGRVLEFAIDDLLDSFPPEAGVSLARLSLALGRFVQTGRAQLIYRIQSPTGGGIGDYSSLGEIPDTLADRFDDWREIEITPDRITPVYLFRCRS